MIDAFFTETATKEVLSSTTKTVRTFGSGVSIPVSEVQAQNEMDLIQGVYVTKYCTYAAFDADIKQNDKLTISGIEYLVLESIPYKVRNIEFKQILMTTD